MRTYINRLSAILLLLFTTIASAQYIQIDENYTAQQLVENVLINSTCASVSGFSVSGGNFSDGSRSYARFTNTSPDFPFTDGIVLSTGKATSTQGPNTYISDDGGSMGWTGDSDLEQALGVSGTTNRTLLEFDFVPLSDKISFDYIFASEEYHDNAQCQYSDGFAFLLKKTSGTPTPYDNLALIPGTTIPVKVTSVHPAVSGGCAAQNEAYFGSYNPTEYPTNFNGQTVVMTAQSVVEPGETYHIKLVIADEGNYRYDSAIFLKGGSFSVATDLGTDRTLIDQNPLCSGETLTLDATQSSAIGYQWYKDNAAITNAINPTLTVSTAGTYKVEVTINATCTSTGEIRIEYAPITANSTDLFQCDDNTDGITTFNLTNVNQIVTGGLAGVTIQGYYHNPTDAQLKTNSITNFQAYQNSTTNETVIVRVENQFNCVAYGTITLKIANNTINPAAFEKCDSDTNQNGITEFTQANFTTITNQIITVNSLPSGVVINYFTTAQAAVTQSNPITAPFTNATINQQIIYARIINGSDCYGIIPVTLTVNTFSPSGFQDEVRAFCQGNSTMLDAGAGFNTYTWNTTPIQTSQFITVSDAGNYIVTVTNNKGCSATKKFIVTASGIATITNIAVNSFSGNDNTITVSVSGLGNYEYSLDNINYQDSNVFTNLNPGEYLVYVHDKNECGTTPPQLVYVLDYPHFFTPNGDGYNDTWRINNLELDYPNATLLIFDRYGKLIKQIATSGEGWNGTFNNQLLPATDYWFTLTLENGRIIKGHFALKR
jgi:gliding motility-associated-like protein